MVHWTEMRPAGVCHCSTRIAGARGIEHHCRAKVGTAGLDARADIGEVDLFVDFFDLINFRILAFRRRLDRHGQLFRQGFRPADGRRAADRAH